MSERRPWWPVVVVFLAMAAFLMSGTAFILNAVAAKNGAPAAEAAEDTGDAPTTGTVAVELTEWAVTTDEASVPAGRLDLAVTNSGDVPHTVAIAGVEGTETPSLNGGETASISTELAPGTYELICTIPGHKEAGMTTELTVTAAGEDVEPAMDHGSMDGSENHAAAQAEMEKLMAESIGAFPAETEGAGAELLEPTILDDGTRFFELVVDEIEWEVEPGKVVDAVAYNGAVPGPTMKVDVGDKVTIRVTNELDDEGTSLHPHGLKDHAFELDGVTYVSQEPIASGDSMDYTFVADQEAVVTYHSHHMSLHQVPNGLFGALIVGDWAGLAGIEGVVDEEVMILNDAGNIGFSLNGKSFPATEPYSYKVGDKVIVHYANEGQMAHPMHLHNQPGTVIAKDGFLLSEGARYQGDTFNVAPGERLTVVYEMKTPGTWVWHCHVLSHVKRSDGSMFGMLTAVIVEE